MYFRQKGLRKTWLLKCLKSRVSEHPSTVNMLKGPKHCWNLHGSTFIRLFHHSKRNWVGKCLLVISEILELCLKTLTVDGKYSLNNRENLLQPIQMKFSKKQIVFSQRFAAFLKSLSNFQHFLKKDKPYVFPNLETVK